VHRAAIVDNSACPNGAGGVRMRVSSVPWVRWVGLVAIAVAWLPVLLARPRGPVGVALALSVVIAAALLVQWRWSRSSALRVIRQHPFPDFLRQKLRDAHPQLDDAAALQVERGLRQFFGANAQADGQFVAMPSKVVDALWHEFILYTRGYEAFCRRAFGRLLHHTPAEALPAIALGRQRLQRREGLRRAWVGACRDEGIDPRRPDRLPLLFALDASLGIAGGYVYALDCSLPGVDRSSTHCAGEFGSSSCGGSGGDGGGGGDGGDGGGGCGGD
jgi:hypothetical protein